MRLPCGEYTVTLTHDSNAEDGEGNALPEYNGHSASVTITVVEVTDISVDKDVICLGEAAPTFTITTKDEGYSSHFEIDKTLYNVNKAGSYTVWAKCAEGGDYTSQGTAYAELKVVEVDLTLEDSNLTPDLEEDICLNAQEGYKKVKYKAKVLPAGTTATVSVKSGGVTVSPSSVSDESIVTVTGTSKGDYEIEIVHDLCDDCPTTAGGIVFKFIDDLDTFSKTPNTTGDHSTATDSGSGIDLEYDGSGPDSDAGTATGILNGKYSIKVDPDGSYSGDIKANCKFSGQATLYDLEGWAFPGVKVGSISFQAGSSKSSYKGTCSVNGASISDTRDMPDQVSMALPAGVVKSIADAFGDNIPPFLQEFIATVSYLFDLNFVATDFRIGSAKWDKTYIYTDSVGDTVTVIYTSDLDCSNDFIAETKSSASINEPSVESTNFEIK